MTPHERILAVLPADAWIGQAEILARVRMAPASLCEALRDLVEIGDLERGKLVKGAQVPGRPAAIYRRRITA